MDKSKGWGKIMVGVRFEKMVEADFVRAWSMLLVQGLRKGDMFEIPPSSTAHKASNNIVRRFLKTDCDSLMFLDSDADFSTDFLNQLRDFEPGFQFDGFQAFYTVRGWPPEAVWFQRDGFNKLHKCLLFDENMTEEVDFVGTHCALFRREMFETMLGDNDPKTFDWFYYPRHKGSTEDAAFCLDAKQYGYRFGATTAVRTNHIAHVPIGWEAYQDYLRTSGNFERIGFYDRLVKLLIEWTGLEPEEVQHRMSEGSKNVSAAWDKNPPQTAEELRAFYQDKDNGYLYDLANWNSSLPYIGVLRNLDGFKEYDVLVIGAGLGTEAELLAYKNKVDVFELPGHLKEFCKWRLKDTATMLDGDTLPKAIEGKKYNLIVSIDVLEHVHPDELDAVLQAIADSLADEAILCCHNNWGQQDIYPMHFDHSEKFNEWVEKIGLEKLENNFWIRNKETK